MLSKLILTLFLGLVMAGPATPIVKSFFANGSPIGSAVVASASAQDDDDQGEDNDDQGEDNDDQG